MILLFRFFFFFLSKTESFVWTIKRKILVSKLAACGKEVWVGRNWKITPETVYIGNDVSIGVGAIIQSTSSKIILCNHIMFGPNVSVHGGNHRTDILGRYMKSITMEEKRAGVDDEDVLIEDDVWIGSGAIILKGVTIGRGSVIGAGVVVYKSVPPYSIVTGTKMEVKKRFNEEQILKHESLLCQNENQ